MVFKWCTPNSVQQTGHTFSNWSADEWLRGSVTPPRIGHRKDAYGASLRMIEASTFAVKADVLFTRSNFSRIFARRRAVLVIFTKEKPDCDRTGSCGTWLISMASDHDMDCDFMASLNVQVCSHPCNLWLQCVEQTGMPGESVGLMQRELVATVLMLLASRALEDLRSYVAPRIRTFLDPRGRSLMSGRECADG